MCMAPFYRKLTAAIQWDGGDNKKRRQRSDIGIIMVGCITGFTKDDSYGGDDHDAAVEPRRRCRMELEE